MDFRQAAQFSFDWQTRGYAFELWFVFRVLAGIGLCLGLVLPLWITLPAYTLIIVGLFGFAFIGMPILVIRALFTRSAEQRDIARRLELRRRGINPEAGAGFGPAPRREPRF